MVNPFLGLVSDVDEVLDIALFFVIEEDRGRGKVPFPNRRKLKRFEVHGEGLVMLFVIDDVGPARGIVGAVDAF